MLYVLAVMIKICCINKEWINEVSSTYGLDNSSIHIYYMIELNVIQTHLTFKFINEKDPWITQD